MKISDIFNNSVYRNFFLTVFGGVFVASVFIAASLGLFPDEFSTVGSDVEETTDKEVLNRLEEIHGTTRPIRIDIPSVGISTTVVYPSSVSIAELDNALLKGAVYYPGSGTVEKGNMFVFGHSTGLSVVRNQSFKTFNNLKDVNEGAIIQVTGDNGNLYEYEVISVELVDEDEALVQFDTSSQMITLSTCNTFGEKQERHVVKAVYKGQI